MYNLATCVNTGFLTINFQQKLLIVRTRSSHSRVFHNKTVIFYKKQLTAKSIHINQFCEETILDVWQGSRYISKKYRVPMSYTLQKIKFSIKDFYNKCDQI